jgi:hypothetical protein
MRVVYLIEVEGDGKWTPMYLPCYSRAEAEKKQKTKARLFGAARVRIGIYSWIGSSDAPEPPRAEASLADAPKPYKLCTHDELKWGRKKEVFGGKEITVCGRCREEVASLATQVQKG